MPITTILSDYYDGSTGAEDVVGIRRENFKNLVPCTPITVNSFVYRHLSGVQGLKNHAPTLHLFLYSAPYHILHPFLQKYVSV